MNKINSIKINKKFFIVLSAIVFSLAAIFIGFSIANTISSNDVTPAEDMAINNSDTDKVAATLPNVNGETEEKSFSFDITTKDSKIFTLPVCANVSEANYWLVNWGDGKEAQYVEVSNSNVEKISHDYSKDESIVDTFTITIKPAKKDKTFDPDAVRWMSRFGCYSINESFHRHPYIATSKDMIATVNTPLTWDMIRKEINTPVDNEYAEMFRGCINLNFNADSKFTLPVEIGAVGNNFCSAMFADCKNLKKLPEGFVLPQNLTEAKDGFVQAMFFNCSSLESLPVNLNLPQNLIAVGNNFASSMFSGCSSLAVLPKKFNFPQNIEVNNPYNYFAQEMFSNCVSLTTLGDDFKFSSIVPLRSSGIYVDSFRYTFKNCHNLTGSIKQIVGKNDRPLGNMESFADCDNMVDYYEYYSTGWIFGTIITCFKFKISTQDRKEFVLPDYGNVNETNYWLVNWGDGSAEEFVIIRPGSYNQAPHDYSTAGDFTITIRPATDDGVFKPNATKWLSRFATYDGSYYACSPATEMITVIKTPLVWQMTRSAIDEAPNKECAYMFFYCEKLNFVENSEFTFPKDITVVGNAYALNMFKKCSALTKLPEKFSPPQSVTAVGDNFASNIFNDCSALTKLPENFNLPQTLTAVGDNFASSMFLGCSALTKLPENFNLPQNILPQGLTIVGNNFANSMFMDCINLETVSSNFTFPMIITIFCTASKDAFLNTFKNCSALVGSIKTITGRNVEPNDVRNTFVGCEKCSDYSDYCGTNWIMGRQPK